MNEPVVDRDAKESTVDESLLALSIAKESTVDESLLALSIVCGIRCMTYLELEECRGAAGPTGEVTGLWGTLEAFRAAWTWTGRKRR